MILNVIILWDTSGCVKVVMTGSVQNLEPFQSHIRSKSRLETLRTHYRDPVDPFRPVIVREIGLTDFDALMGGELEAQAAS